jgi:hypothetical protein
MPHAILRSEDFPFQSLVKGPFTLTVQYLYTAERSEYCMLNPGRLLRSLSSFRGCSSLPSSSSVTVVPFTVLCKPCINTS